MQAFEITVFARAPTVMFQQLRARVRAYCYLSTFSLQTLPSFPASLLFPRDWGSPCLHFFSSLIPLPVLHIPLSGMCPPVRIPRRSRSFVCVRPAPSLLPVFGAVARPRYCDLPQHGPSPSSGLPAPAAYRYPLLHGPSPSPGHPPEFLLRAARRVSGPSPDGGTSCRLLPLLSRSLLVLRSLPSPPLFSTRLSPPPSPLLFPSLHVPPPQQ